MKIFKKKVTQEELGQYDYQVSYILSGVDRKIDDLADALGYKFDVDYTPEGAKIKLVKKPAKRKPVKKGKK